MKLFKVFSPLLFILCWGCDSGSVKVVIRNCTMYDRFPELAEVRLESVKNALALADYETFYIQDSADKEIPYQITFDGKVVFPVQLNAGEVLTLDFKKGKPTASDTLVYGCVYHDRLDDLAWENDKVGFRAYGPGLETSEEWKNGKMYGYDIFLKRGTDLLVLPRMYQMKIELDRYLVNTDDDEKKREMIKNKSYHIDHGYGMDCYAVGPTLGAGASAILNANEIIFPECYKDCRILDNGPFRFTAQLRMKPVVLMDIAADNDTITEIRTISLDLGSYLNKTTVDYKGLDKDILLVSGFPLHGKNKDIYVGSHKEYVSYSDPTTGSGNGNLFLGHVYNEATYADIYIDEYELANKKYSHLFAERTYRHGQDGFTYWWGFGWNKAGVETISQWNNYLEKYHYMLINPLVIGSVKN